MRIMGRSPDSRGAAERVTTQEQQITKNQQAKSSKKKKCYSPKEKNQER